MPHITDTLLLVSPDDFQYNPATAATNSFMSETNQTNVTIQAQAMEEFDHYVQKLRDHSIQVIVLASNQKIKTPDAVYPNNWFSTFINSEGKTDLIIYPMLAENRQAEIRVTELIAKLAENHIHINHTIDLSTKHKQQLALEGTGSIVFDHSNKIMYVSLSARADQSLAEELAKLLRMQLILFHSYDKQGQLIYHTNIVMSLGDNFSVVCLEAIHDSSERAMLLHALEKTSKKMIEISLTQAENMCGNILQVKSTTGKKYNIMSQTAFAHFTQLQQQTLQQFAEPLVVAIPTIETIGGGSARCMIAEIFHGK